MLWFTRHDIVSIAVGFCLLSCSDDPEPAESTADPDLLDLEDSIEDPAVERADPSDEEPLRLVNPFPEIPHTALDPEADPEGHEDVLAELAEGEVRAGLITSWDTTFSGPEADCRPDDYKIYNSRVQFCISGLTAFSQISYTGGHLIDADFVGEGNDRFFMASLQNHLLLPAAEEIRVLSDGSSGLAVISVRGGEEPMAILSNIVGNITPYRGVTIETEFRLEPDVTYLEIVTWIRAENSNSGLSAGEFGLLGDTTVPFYANTGRIAPETNDSFPWVAATGEGRSYAFFAPNGYSGVALDLNNVAAGFPIVALIQARGLVPHTEEGAFRRYFLVGHGGTAELVEPMAAIRGANVGARVTFEVTEGGAAAPGVNLLVSDNEGSPIAIAYTDADGRAVLPAGSGSYTVVPEDWVGGDVVPLEFTINSEDITVEVALPASALLTLTVTSLEPGSGSALPGPAKVDLRGPRSELLFTHNGTVAAPVRAGTYTIVVSRGEEFTAVVFDDVELVAGEETALEADLERVWDTAGLISGEFHQHQTPSPDSQVTLEDRVLSNIVEGVDFVVPSDHGEVTDVSAVIASLGAEALLYSVPSIEVSPNFGHFGALPMVFDPALQAGGAIQLGLLQEGGRVVLKTFPDMVEELREDFDVQVIQMNHPRSFGAMLDYARYDPLEGPDGAISSRFTVDFDSIEVVNDKAHTFCEVFTDWLSLVSRGHRITGVGNSDSHGLSREAGYPRNYLPSDAADASEITDDDIIDALLDGNVSVSGGALITLPDGPALGSTVTIDAETLTLRVLIQTPTWGTVDHLAVVMHGAVVQTIEIDAVVEGVVAFDDDIEITPPDRDDYLILVARGDTPMTIVTSGENPFGFTNPVFLDVDGEEGWTPPGVESDGDLVRLPEEYCD
jgi:hypothetical protein